MNLLKSLKERKAITIFFIICFTVGILIFSVGNSAIVSQNNKIKEFSPENNKIIGFRNYQGVMLKDLQEAIKSEGVTTLIIKSNYETSTGIETYILQQGKELEIDIKSGEKLTNEDLIGSSAIGVYSSRLKEELQLSSSDGGMKVKIDRVGVYYDMDRRVIIPNELFFNLYGNMDVNNSELQIILRGDYEKVQKVVKKIEMGLKDKNIKNGLLVNSVEVVDRAAEGRALYNASIMIFIITIINSVSISALWVKSRKKEIVIRKVFGAKNIDISKIFFGELLMIAVISLIISIIIQYGLTRITSGYIFNIDLRLNIETIINSFFIATITSFSVSLPSFKYISKIQPAEMLKGE